MVAGCCSSPAVFGVLRLLPVHLHSPAGSAHLQHSRCRENCSSPLKWITIRYSLHGNSISSSPSSLEALHQRHMETMKPHHSVRGWTVWLHKTDGTLTETNSKKLFDLFSTIPAGIMTFPSASSALAVLSIIGMTAWTGWTLQPLHVSMLALLALRSTVSCAPSCRIPGSSSLWLFLVFLHFFNYMAVSFSCSALILFWLWCACDFRGFMDK